MVKPFTAEWLRLREPFDAASRTSAFWPVLAPGLRPSGSLDERIHVIDLGAGTGSNFRFMAPLLGGAQEWLLVEHDRLLLGALPGRLRRWADSRRGQLVSGDDKWAVQGLGIDCRVQPLLLDMATEPDRLSIPQGALVTASALLDLVSESFLTRLVQRCSESSAGVWFALTVDGRIHFSPPEPEDSTIRSLFNAHQQRDKGFGLALGPQAAQKIPQLLRDQGYEVHVRTSDWEIHPQHDVLQHALLEGWFSAAIEMNPDNEQVFRGWRDRRRRHIDRGQSEMVVGHVDVAGRTA